MTSFLERFRSGKRPTETPTEKSKQVVKCNGWDQEAYHDIRMAHSIDAAIEELIVMHDEQHAPELIQDTWMLAWKALPQLRDKRELDVEVKSNSQIISILSELPEMHILQRYSGGDEAISILAVERMLPAIKELLELEPTHVGDFPVPVDDDDPRGEPTGGTGSSPTQQPADEGDDESDDDGCMPGGPAGQDDEQGDDDSGDSGSKPDNDDAEADDETTGDNTEADDNDGERDNSSGSTEGNGDEGDESGGGDNEATDSDDSPGDGGEWADAPELDEQQVQDILTRAISDVRSEIQDLKEAERSIGSEFADWSGNADPAERLATLAQLARMQDLLDLVGRMKRFALGERATRITPSEHAVEDVEMGSDIRKMLPHQFALLARPETRSEFYFKYAENGLLQWKMSGTESAGKGPIVMLVDQSGSMAGAEMDWALAVTEAMRRVAQDEQRNVIVQFFNAGLSHRYEFPNGHGTMSEVLDMLSTSANGGTSFTEPFDFAMSVIENAPEFSTADIVMITDGAASPESSWIEEFNARRDELGVKTFGIYIGRPSPSYVGPNSALGQTCDFVIPVEELTLEAAKTLFSKL